MDSDVQSDSTSSLEESGDSGDENDSSETCCFKNRVLRLPGCFCSEEDVFNEVLSPSTWKSVLNSKHGERLKAFLPEFPENDEKEKDETIRKLIEGENFKFGNPFKNFFNKLKDGFLSSDVVEIRNALKRANYREYKNQLQQYSYHLLQDVLVSRKKLINSAYNSPPDHAVKMVQFIAKPKDAIMHERTRLRYFSTLQEMREEVAALDTSSEDENYPETNTPKIFRKFKKQLSHDTSFNNELSRISATTSYPIGSFGYGHINNQCNEMLEISEERYREMLLTHKERTITDPKNPKLITSKIEMRDVTARVNFGKRQKSAENHTRKKPKNVESLEKSNSVFLSDSVEGESSSVLFNREESSFNSSGPDTTSDMAPSVQETEVQTDPLTILEEDDSQAVFDAHHQNNRLPSPHPDVHQYPTCFFALLRDLFCESAEKKLSASKLEEKVRNWQNGPTATLFEWLHYQESWSDLVSPALKFLAGDFINQLPDSFVPFLDYKEKQQQWQWIGSGRDSDEQLFALCQQWVETKDDISSDIMETCQGSPPPPRVTTGWTVRPTADEEKKLYREQECIRYQNPHKAFTFKVHGYEAVVGPVKGVYGKESGINKAREHSLLTSDRPPFVTILSLVRDSAARLPNGEGTRADICELLKDSQYLAPASDQQIHTVVSGALDRLHYEKDPCVKYDVNRKLWIYLHRHRTEEEFERIHQAQAAAAKAKKAVQKGKFPKIKSKEVSRTTTNTTQVSSAEPIPSLSLDVSAPTLVPSVNVQSPKGGSSPRTQANSKLPPTRFLIHHNMVSTSQPETKNAAVGTESLSKSTEVATDLLDPSVDSKQAIASIIAAQTHEINMARQSMLGSTTTHSKTALSSLKNSSNANKTIINNTKSTVSIKSMVSNSKASMSHKAVSSNGKTSVNTAIKTPVNSAKTVVNKGTITNPKPTSGNPRATVSNMKNSVNNIKTTFSSIKTTMNNKTPMGTVKATMSNSKSTSTIKPTVTNVPGTQIVSVTPVQIKSIKTEPGLPVNVLTPSVHDVLNVDMKPSSPSYVGQPPVLQPILSHTSAESSGSHSNVTTTSPSLISSTAVNKAKINCPNLAGFPGAIAGFQTIVIKQEPGLRPCNGVSTIPLLSIEERLPSTSPSAINSAPVVARLVHGSQYLSFCNIAANSTTCSSSKPIAAAMQNFRVQGGNICQQVLSASTIKVINSAPVSAIADTRVPVLALKNQISPGKEPTLLAQSPAALNVCGRLYQMTNIRNAVISKDAKDISEPKVNVCPKETPDVSSKDTKDLNISSLPIPTISYGNPVNVANRNTHPFVKVSPK